MRVYKGIVTIIFAGLMLAGISGCEKEGPAEKAGKAIDEAASNVADDAQGAVDTLKEKAEE